MVKNQLLQFIQNPDSSAHSYSLASAYFAEKQYSIAFNYFLRTAELSDEADRELTYKSLIYCSLCLYRQGARMNAAMHHLVQAKSLIPARVEARYLHAKMLQEIDENIRCYEECRTALTICDYGKPVIEGIGYPGQFALETLQSLSGWKIGKSEECRQIAGKLYELYVQKNSDIPAEEKKKIVDHCIALKIINPESFTGDLHEKLKFKFPGSELIKKNYSHSYQDVMIISLLNGKKNGTYLEIGSCYPYEGNNTALLEETFDWRGVSVDYDADFVREFNEKRKNKTLMHDATTLDYNIVLSSMKFPNDIDYLQLDCDPPEVTYQTLLKIPFDKYRFAVITYEHDFYYKDKSLPYRDWSRSYLISKGYVPVVNDVGAPRTDEYGERSYEDWWIHPALIDPAIFQQLKVYGEGPNQPEKFLFK